MSSSIVPLDEFLAGYMLFQQWGPGKSFLAGLATAVVAHAALSTLYDGQLTQRALMKGRGLVRKALRPLVVREIHKKTREMIFENSARVPVHDALPAHGYDNETIIKYAKQLQEDLDLGWDGAHFLSGSVYHGGAKHTDLINRVMELYQWSNPLHMDSFRAVRIMEAEVVEMCVRIFNGHLLRRPEQLAAFQREGIAAAASTTASAGTAIAGNGTATAAVEGGEKANALTPVTAAATGSMPMPNTYALATELEDNPCGCMTTGGSDSIAMAVKVYRDFARETRGITNPNLVMPITAHPAFNKACQYFGIRCITVPVCMATGRVEVAELEKYITCDTICVVASACNYPFGTVDPVQDIAAMIVARYPKVGLHVDCCLGGFTIQFLERAGIPNAPVVDFRVPGVTSISCDTHKFGFAPKGTSVVLYRNKKLRMCQFFSIATWPGGIYASPGLNGSRAGNTIAGAWASMLSHGMDGYTRTAVATYTTMKKVAKGISEIPTLYVIGIPQASVVAFTSDVIDVYIMAARLAKRTPIAWHLSSLHFPVAVHFSLTYVHSQPGIAEKFLADTREVVMELLAERERALAAGEKIPAVGAQGATVYGSQQRISDRTVVEDVGRVFLDKYFHTHQPSKEQAAAETM